MGSAQSSDRKREAADLAPTSSSEVGSIESDDNKNWTPITNSAEELDEESDDDDDDEEEDDEEIEERLCILQETRQLAKLAEFFLHPEKPVRAESAVCGRCYFKRFAAEQPLSEEEEEEAAKILAEVKSLKSLAVDFMHPELPVVSDATACARCYFDRASAPSQEAVEEEAERELILKDLAKLKKAATHYLHPEAPLEVDPTVFGRNYFTRPSAPIQPTEEEEAESKLILKDAMKLAKLAHAIRGDAPTEYCPTFFGRNYFTRPSAPKQTTMEDEEERSLILADARALKRLAVDYMHPERPVQVDSTACARNYFTRPSAPLQEDDDVDEERQEIFKEMALMKQQAAAYLHPEHPLSVDPTYFGRNYFGRASAEDKDTFGAAEERARIIAEAVLLKKQATMYMHPERPVVNEDPCAFGRNYFTRPSAPMELPEEEEQRQLILEDTKTLYKLAVDYRHPELPVTTTDPTAFGRNYFNRPSAFEQFEKDDELERQLVLEDAKALRKLAVDFAHPELPVVTDSTAFGRNYFSRASAAPQTNVEDDNEEELVLIEAGKLEQLAVDYRHPELPVRPRDPTAEGRDLLAVAVTPVTDNTHHVLTDEEDEYWHHAHFDMEDHIHLHHVDFDMNKAHHEEISQVKHASPTTINKVMRDFDEPIPGSPGCIMSFAQPEMHNLPQLP